MYAVGWSGGDGVGLLPAGRAPEIWAGGVTICDGAPTKTPKPQLRG